MCDTVTVAPPRYAVFQIMGTRKIINNVDSMYEVLLPHVVGGSLKDAIAKTPEDMHGDFVSAQRSGTCYHRCILAATRYLLKRKGMQPLQQKQVFYALRVAYLDWTLDDLKRVEAIDDSDERLIAIACAVTAGAAVKQSKRPGGLGAEDLRRIQEKVKAVQTAVRPLHNSGTEFEFPEALNLKQSVEFKPFEDFGMFHDDRDTEVYAGTAAKLVHKQFTDLLSVATVDNFSHVAAAIKRLCLASESLVLKVDVSSPVIAKHQILAITEHVFTRVLPPPTPWSEGAAATTSPWVPETISLELQRDLLSSLCVLCCAVGVRNWRISPAICVVAHQVPCDAELRGGVVLAAIRARILVDPIHHRDLDPGSV